MVVVGDLLMPAALGVLNRKINQCHNASWVSHFPFTPFFSRFQAILQATEEARNVACRVKGRVSA